MFCKNCGQEMDNNAIVCVHCGCAKNTGASFCPNCGAQTQPNMAFCTSCGGALSGGSMNSASGQQKSKIAAGLLGIFLGGFGVHNFYLGYTKKAVIQLVVSLAGGIVTCGIATLAIEIWGLVEGIMILAGSINVDGQGIPLKD